MSIFEKGSVTILGCALLLGLIAIPLALRKIPRNVVYGFRTRATLADESVWYEVNAHFGRGLLMASAVMSIAGFALHRAQGLPPALFLKASIAVLVAPLLVATLATARFLRTLTPGRGRR